MKKFVVAAALLAALPAVAHAQDAPSAPPKMECCEKMKSQEGGCACCKKMGGEHADHGDHKGGSSGQPSQTPEHKH